MRNSFYIKVFLQFLDTLCNSVTFCRPLVDRFGMYLYRYGYNIENVSMCRCGYILEVSDTYTVSYTKGLTS